MPLHQGYVRSAAVVFVAELSGKHKVLVLQSVILFNLVEHYIMHAFLLA